MATAELQDAPSKKTGKPGADQVQCQVVTPEKVVIDETAEFVALPLSDGEIGILHGRAPLIARLGYGELRLTSGSMTRRYFVDGGFVQVRDDVVTVLTPSAMTTDQLDVSSAEEALAQARGRVATTEPARQEKDRTLARARAMIRLGSRLG